MKQRLQEALASLPENAVVLTILPNENYEELNMHMVDLLVNKRKINGAYITVNRPYASIISMMEQNNIDHKKLFFIDCITEKEEQADNCVFMTSPESLTNIGIALDPIYNSKEHSFVILDSLDALSVYHDHDSIIKFAHSLINRMREHGMSGIMIGLPEGTDKRILDQLASFCDTVVDLTD